jgi:hypothetical protein
MSRRAPLQSTRRASFDVLSYSTGIDKDYIAREMDAVSSEIRSLKEEIERNMDKQMQESHLLFMSMSGNPATPSATAARQELRPNPQHHVQLPTGIPNYYMTVRSADKATTPGASRVKSPIAATSFTTPGQNT